MNVKAKIKIANVYSKNEQILFTFSPLTLPVSAKRSEPDGQMDKHPELHIHIYTWII